MTVPTIRRCLMPLAFSFAAVFVSGAHAQTAAPANAPKNLNTELTDMIERWGGDYREQNADGVTTRWAAVRQVDAPGLAPLTLYIEVHQAVPVDKIIYQRLIGFDSADSRTRNWATSYAFANPEDNQRMDRQADKLKKLSAKDLLTMGPGCEMNLFQESGTYTLTIHKDTCRVANKLANGPMLHPELRIAIGKDSFSFSDESFRDNGDVAQPALKYTVKKMNAALRRE